ncbi:MAG: hypothetical protein E6K71_09910 [Candidatus Eisenbacteria bacterium]|uniref:Protein kinase domain-containing protein n=2 Tax=Eiseniibacteriota bacterium TaxID=2212470 RepID=A0A538S7T8_UNCEI|nr:MAG: hypothetical protein E6K71_09910 [Candidatus Eisenbacteria bacterium]
MTNPSVPKRYEVRSLLGEGGSSRVYRVQDSIRDRELALKLVTSSESAFLRREFDTLRQIRHENLIQVFDWGALPSGEAYYTMELIEGGDWSRRMGKPQPADDVRHILTGCRADGLSGTPGYAAPEVWEGAPADIRSDLYSVGVMAYEALTGKHPFAGHTVREVVSGQLEGWVPSPGVHGIRVPIDLERVAMRALERKPGLRQGSADEFMEGMGVEDRIGEILGGKLVGREGEIDEINRILNSKEPGMPTLVYLAGEPGVGKTALLEEVGARLLRLGGRALEIDLSRGKPLEAQIAEHLAPAGAEIRQAHEGSKELHTLLIECGRQSPVLLYTAACDETASRSTLKALARYIWALSVETRQASRVVIALQSSTMPDTAEPFARNLHVPPLSALDCDHLMRQALGAANVQLELIAKLHALSGGNAGVLRAALASLIERQLLQRRDGTWAFREATLIHSMRLETGMNPWAIAWRHLSSAEQRVMLTITLFRQPLDSVKLKKLSMDTGIDESLSTLQAKGFLRSSREGWVPASDGVRQTVQELASKASQAEIAADILATVPDRGDGEDRIDLELRYRPSVDRLERGLEAAERAVSRGDQYLGMKRLQACLEIAERGEVRERSRQICLRIAALLRQLGDDEGAAGYLQRQESWGNGSPSPNDEARRSHVLGLIAMSKGDLDGARRSLSISVEMATVAGDRSLLLRCHADLAEIDWRHPTFY